MFCKPTVPVCEICNKANDKLLFEYVKHVLRNLVINEGETQLRYFSVRIANVYCVPHVQTKTRFNVELSKADKLYTMQHAQIKSVLQTVDFVFL